MLPIFNTLLKGLVRRPVSNTRMFHADACGNRFVVIVGPVEAIEAAWAVFLVESDPWPFDSVIAVCLEPTAVPLMRTLESDGSESVMCGNGARAIGAALDRLGMPRRIRLADGRELDIGVTSDGLYSVPMGHVRCLGGYPLTLVENAPSFHLYDACGEPHAVAQVPSTRRAALQVWGEAIVPGANCTLVGCTEGRVYARTYERGVNRETQSCGTGATAAAQYLLDASNQTGGTVSVRMPGGMLRIRVEPERGSFLEGPAHVRAIV